LQEAGAKVVDEGHSAVSWVMVKGTPLQEGVDTPCKKISQFPFHIHSAPTNLENVVVDMVRKDVPVSQNPRIKIPDNHLSLISPASTP
jgi:hypothetical protein